MIRVWGTDVSLSWHELCVLFLHPESAMHVIQYEPTTCIDDGTMIVDRMYDDKSKLPFKIDTFSDM